MEIGKGPNCSGMHIEIFVNKIIRGLECALK